jgi:hypothetical protein
MMVESISLKIHVAEKECCSEKSLTTFWGAIIILAYKVKKLLKSKVNHVKIINSFCYN